MVNEMNKYKEPLEYSLSVWDIFLEEKSWKMYIIFALKSVYIVY